MAKLLKRFMDEYDISADVREQAKAEGFRKLERMLSQRVMAYIKLRDGVAFYTSTSIPEQLGNGNNSNYKRW